ncbi:MAG TPA: hypothetical protein VIF09_12660 [Polyangiaceae bacterium]
MRLPLAIAPQSDPPAAPAWAPERGSAAGTTAPRWELPRGVLAHLLLETPLATRLYWGSVALVVASLFVTKLLPCVDYPQHLALSDVARRLGDPSSPEQAAYELNYFTYNGLFHVVVAWLARVFPIELAGRLVVAFSLAAMAGAVVALLRVLRRPAVHAALFTPVLFSYSLGWGFVNYVLATAIVAWTLVFVARAVIRPSVASVLAVGALGLLCAFAHVLAMLILCLAATALALELAWRSGPPGGPFWKRALRAKLHAALALLPLLIGCIYCIEVYRRQYVWDPNMYRDPTLEGTAPALWAKVLFFGAYASDLFWDGSDQVLLWVALALMAWSEVLAWKARRAGDSPREEAPALVAPFLVLTIAYLATPMVLVGTHLIFPRLGQWLVFGAVLAVPAFASKRRALAHRLVLGLGLVSAANLFLHCALYGVETYDASRVIDDLPPGKSATAVVWDTGTYAFRNGTLTHLAAYYAARKHGQWAFAFARYLSVPVRFRPGSQPAWPAKGWEFDGEQYDARCKYARAFPLVIVRAPLHLPTDASAEAKVREIVFKQDARAVRLLSHHGHFWAFDTEGLPDDGRL